jgi:hypothetical protein
MMRRVVTAADRIDHWVRRSIVPCAVPTNDTKLARNRKAALTAIGQSLREQYDALAAPVPPHLASLIKRFEDAAALAR